MRPGESTWRGSHLGTFPDELRPVLLLTGAVGSVPESWLLIFHRDPSEVLPRISFWTLTRPEFQSTI